ARPRCGAAGAERDRLAHAAWNEYDACAPSGCLRMRGILLARSPRILRLQTVFRILTSAHSCRIRDDNTPPQSTQSGTARPDARCFTSRSSVVNQDLTSNASRVYGARCV